MASQSEHPPSPAEPQAPPATTTIRDLSGDLLREIFLRLPSLPSLVRAALSCRAFLAAVRSSPAFRRRFRALHPPHLLGFFFDPDDIVNESPTFTPVRRGSDDRDHAAAVRGLDVFLTRVPHQDDVFPGWQIMECRGGCLLLSNYSTKQLAVYNPLAGALDLVPWVADEMISEGHFTSAEYFICTEYFLVAPDDEASDRLSFRVVCFCHDEYLVRAAVFSSATRKWQVLPVSEPVLTQFAASGVISLLKGSQANGFLCWSHQRDSYMVLLDTATLQFSVIDLPPGLTGQGRPCTAVGNNKDGKLCIVASTDFTLCVWFRTSDADGIDKWVLQNVIQLEGEVLGANGGLYRSEQLVVFAVMDGIVYMTTYETLRDDTMPRWYLSFCLETRKLEKIFYVKADGLAHPYLMPWPTSLLEMEHPLKEKEKSWAMVAT